MPAPQDPAASILKVSPRELHARIEAGEPLALLDVREPRERQLCSIKTPALDLHIPMRDVPMHLDEIRAASARAPLVVYCHHGIRSMAVAEWLAGRGISGIINLRGGIDAWSREADSSVPMYA